MGNTSTTRNSKSSFWKSRAGIAIQVAIVLTPSAIFLRSGNLLLLGVLMGVIFSWAGLWLRNLNWTIVGLHRPGSYKKIVVTIILSTLIIIILSYLLRQLVTFLTDEKPNLDSFKAVKGNPAALILGLAVAWLFGAFGEEMLFRGFLLNSFYNLLPDKMLNNKIKWALSLFVTSFIVGIGHVYQGITGMILTGFIGFFFGLVYLFSERNLWSCIFTHGIYDTVAFCMLYSGFNLDQIFR